MRSFLFKITALGFVSIASMLHAEKVHLGLQGGVSISNFNTPTGITADNVTGFAAGLALEFRLNESLSIQPEGIFIQKGATLAGDGATNVASKINAIDVPVFVRINFGKDVRPYLFAGPNFSFTLSKSLAANAGGAMGSLSFDARQYDFGFAGGAGIELGAFFVNVRYLAGLLNINEGAATWNSRGFLALAGLRI